LYRFAESKLKSMPTPVPTLYQWAGEEEAFEKLFRLFYDKVLQDPLLRPVFEHMSPDHPRHVAHFVAEVFGGPKKYTQEDGGSHAVMVAHHIGKMLDEPKRKRWLELLLETADEIGLPADPEFRSSLVGYLEWGTRIAVLNSTATGNPVSGTTPMPQWGWGETGGPYQPPS
jgi:hemoglobin